MPRRRRNPVDDPRVLRFLDLTRSYCALVEAPEKVEIRVFVERCYYGLLNLLATAPELPVVEGDLDTCRVTSDEYRKVAQGILSKVSKHDLYWMVFEPFEVSRPNAIYGSISDDLADTWRDLKTGLNAANAGKLVNAVCDWRFSFETHWGPFHGTHTISPLFRLCIGEDAILKKSQRRHTPRKPK